jgi:hypothetical protein
MRQQSPLTLTDAGIEEMSVRGRWTSRRHHNQSYRHPNQEANTNKISRTFHMAFYNIIILFSIFLSYHPSWFVNGVY